MLGKTTMNAILCESFNYWYFGEFSIPDLNYIYGQGIIFFKDSNTLFEGWFVNNLS